MLFTQLIYLYFHTVAEVLVAITSSVKETCKKAPTERAFLDKYGRVCLCLDEIILQVIDSRFECAVTCFLESSFKVEAIDF